MIEGNGSKMRILVVDNHTLFRQGLIRLLASEPDISVVGEASDGWEAVIEARRLNPDLVLLDSYAPTENGLEFLRQIRLESPATKFLVLTLAEEPDDLLRAFKNGAQGYILQNSPPGQLFSAIRDVMRGKMVISPYLAGKVLPKLLPGKRAEDKSPQSGLTPREREILELLSTGVSDREIGDQMRLSASTVRHHVHSVLRKLHLRNRVQAAMFIKNQQLHYPNHI